MNYNTHRRRRSGHRAALDGRTSQQRARTSHRRDWRHCSRRLVLGPHAQPARSSTCVFVRVAHDRDPSRRGGGWRCARRAAADPTSARSFTDSPPACTPRWRHSAGQDRDDDDDRAAVHVDRRARNRRHASSRRIAVDGTNETWLNPRAWSRDRRADAHELPALRNGDGAPPRRGIDPQTATSAITLSRRALHVPVAESYHSHIGAQIGDGLKHVHRRGPAPVEAVLLGRPRQEYWARRWRRPRPPGQPRTASSTASSRRRARRDGRLHVDAAPLRLCYFHYKPPRSRASTVIAEGRHASAARQHAHEPRTRPRRDRRDGARRARRLRATTRKHDSGAPTGAHQRAARARGGRRRLAGARRRQEARRRALDVSGYPFIDSIDIRPRRQRCDRSICSSSLGLSSAQEWRAAVRAPPSAPALAREQQLVVVSLTTLIDVVVIQNGPIGASMLHLHRQQVLGSGLGAC